MDHEASVDLVESGATSVSGSGSAEAEVPDIVLVPDTDKGQYMNYVSAKSIKKISTSTSPLSLSNK